MKCPNLGKSIGIGCPNRYKCDEVMVLGIVVVVVIDGLMITGRELRIGVALVTLYEKLRRMVMRGRELFFIKALFMLCVM